MVWVQRELDALHIAPLKRFGQHFLVDTNVRDQLVQQANLTDTDTVLEIGPGLGFLTAALASKAQRVIAVEKDRTLAIYLKEKFSERTNVMILHADALTISIPDHAKIVSSPPYNISSKLIIKILNSHFRTSTLLLQEEFKETDSSKWVTGLRKINSNASVHSPSETSQQSAEISFLSKP